jgi:hypothetical protein
MSSKGKKQQRVDTGRHISALSLQNEIEVEIGKWTKGKIEFVQST